MADGTTKAVEQVQAGDQVLSRNPQTGETQASSVSTTTQKNAGCVLAVTLTDSVTGQRETVLASPEHPFYVQGQGFVPASMLAIGISPRQRLRSL